MTTRRLIHIAAAIALVASLFGAHAQARERRILVVNASDEPIYAIRVGHADQNSWGADVLAFNEVIDVSRGRDLDLPFDPSDCSYDVAATYHDGLVVVLRNIDLCSVNELRFAR